MANKQYPNIAAARHMSTAPMTHEPIPPADPVRSTAAAAPVAAIHPARSTRYRRQRAAAVTVISLVTVSIPTLAILLVVFG